MESKRNSGVIGRREFLHKGSLAALSVPLLYNQFPELAAGEGKDKSVSVKPEWRNKQGGMAYRQLGRTGFMVSELVYGTERITPDNTRPVEIAIERGINYFDTAPQYGRGAAETTLGKVLNTPSKRNNVFIATKISPLPGLRNRLYREIFDTLLTCPPFQINKIVVLIIN